MPEGEILVVVRAVDQVSGNLGKIQNSLENTTNSLIAIGNAASSVDNIFSSLTNMSLRLENASERLANAQDRLEDTNTNVKRAQEDYNQALAKAQEAQDKYYPGFRLRIAAEEDLKKASERLVDAQKDEERATRGLTIAQNNLERAQNQVIGTYINVGVQSLSLLRSLPALIASVRGLATTFGVLNLSMGAVGIALVAVGGIISLVKKNTDETATATNSLSSSMNTNIVVMRDLYDTEGNLVDQTEILTTSIIDRKLEWDELNGTLKVTATTLQDIIDLEAKTGKISRGQGPVGAGFGTVQNFIPSNISVQLNKQFNTKKTS